MHPSETAQLRQERAWDWIRAVPAVPPNTSDEDYAIRRLDEARSDALRQLQSHSRPTVRLDR